MTLNTILVANRGEVALRVFRAAEGLGLSTVGVYTSDDADALHVARCDLSRELPGVGPRGYLDIDAVIDAARECGADAIHPGYGLLSESAALARACADAGIVFVGPDPETLELFGDKGRARALAVEQSIPVVAGTCGATTLAEMERFFDEGGPGFDGGVLIKAVAGGGGRGMRVVTRKQDLADAYEQCKGESEASFGASDLYIEQRLTHAQHIEVQVIGDGRGSVSHLWDRDCSVQRRHQKLIEIAPSRGLAPKIRSEVLAAAVRLAEQVRYRGLLTVEFLVSTDGHFYFMEGNPRLQVEHTVTEEVLDIDLVRAQLQVCAGASLADVGLSQDQIPDPRGTAIEIRINAETVDRNGQFVPSIGTITAFGMPSGRGVRVESACYSGHTTNPRFDSLLAKIVVHDAGGFDTTRRLAARLLTETTISGPDTNLALQYALLDSHEFEKNTITTEFVDENLLSLLDAASAVSERLAPAASPSVPSSVEQATPPIPDGASVIASALGGTVVAVDVTAGDSVVAGQTLAVVEAMKMHYPVRADAPGTVVAVLTEQGQVVGSGDTLFHFAQTDAGTGGETVVTEIDPDFVRPDLDENRTRHAFLYDEQRPEAVSRREKIGMRTARQNVADLVDPGTFVEYGGLAVAAQRQRRDLDDLIRNTPADGIVTGIGTVNGGVFDRTKSTCAVLAYDYTVLAGTQGSWNHTKTDRILEVAHKNRYPVILFAEGGGGRPGDVDIQKVGALDTRTFSLFASLSGKVPTVGIAAGRCFAGNAALLGSCNVVIATENSNIGMGGPAMIEGGGLGRFRPDEIGPIDVQVSNGVVDLRVADEEAAVAAAKKYLGYFQGSITGYDEYDQRRLRHLVPEDRRQAYDVRAVIETLCDVDSVMELRPTFGRTTITALARIDGRAIGIIANDPTVLGGAIDSPGADKLARFLNLCEMYALPMISLCDTPGFLVGPDAEESASVRHFGRLFVRGATMSVPSAVVVLRKAYGLGAVAMAAGSMRNPALSVSWPSGEFGGMGLEGGVRLGFRDELAAITDDQARQERYDELVGHAYERGKAINTAMHLEIDDVIDPADTRAALVAALPDPERAGWINPHLRPTLDTW